jgi:transcriptional regulator with XRE-family HTH domain
LKYEAEVGVIRKKLGDLDEIREQLGLTQRKMCQLLLVDPSAWTRWTRDEEDAPPHIYRMLQWYLALEEKYPALDVNFWLSTVSRGEDPNKSSLRDEKIQNLTQNLAGVSREVEALRYELANQLPEPSPTTLSMQEIESRLALVQKRERLLLVWCALFFAGVAFGLLLHRFG